jgi:hypothetical protein
MMITVPLVHRMHRYSGCVAPLPPAEMVFRIAVGAKPVPTMVFCDVPDYAPDSGTFAVFGSSFPGSETVTCVRVHTIQQVGYIWHSMHPTHLSSAC